MNLRWLEFLNAQETSIQAVSAAQTLYAVRHWSLLEVSGADAAVFLQGQLTCDVLALTEHNATLAAFCNPQGRVISTLWVMKTATDFWLLLPAPLFEIVQTKLRRYVLRSNVQLNDKREAVCLIGVQGEITASLALPATANSISRDPHTTVLRLPSATQPRYWLITSIEQGIELWAQISQQPGIHVADSHAGLYQDILAGIPWFNHEQTEKYIPQMLNLEQLGAISFTKGCYTGQEIVARTHYLGKAKRGLFVASCPVELETADCAVLTAANRQSAGQVLTAFFDGHVSLLLLVLSLDEAAEPLLLADAANTPVTLLSA